MACGSDVYGSGHSGFQAPAGNLLVELGVADSVEYIPGFNALSHQQIPGFIQQSMTTIDGGSYSRDGYQCTCILSRKIASARWLMPVVFHFSLLIIHDRQFILLRRNNSR
jgi:hypothetical protein